MIEVGCQRKQLVVGKFFQQNSMVFCVIKDTYLNSMIVLESTPNEIINIFNHLKFSNSVGYVEIPLNINKNDIFEISNFLFHLLLLYISILFCKFSLQTVKLKNNNNTK